ncbi:MAG TPA: 16S rRNA (guanine(966)-N(2))-methyltransferase RsmD [Alcanivoracaceae bacterium]|nr:16S rRNA (guanine(966)-N(2))-methyltransferase RsmD [Alcanivoracaceae bacterium]
MSKNSVRIIGGRHRGRRLAFQDHNNEVRPSSDRLRETVFNWLQFKLHGAQVLDAFAGSGVLGAEAVSRGAKHATFIELSRQHAQQLKTALAPILNDQHTVVCADALQWLQQTPHTQFHLVFVDPPYHLGLQERLCAALVAQPWLAENALVYVESDSKLAAPTVPATWVLEKEKTMGQIRAQLYICR